MLSLIAIVVVTACIASIAATLLVSTRRAASLHDVTAMDLVLEQRPQQRVRNASLM